MLQLSLYAAYPLFYSTVNFKEDDTLNIRQKPDYHSKKVAHMYLGDRLEVFTCITKKSSKWCKIAPLQADEAVGWVNAKYITPSNYQTGYVIIKDRKSICDYALRCEKNPTERCFVVTGLGDNLQDIKLKTEWIVRSKLRPATNFTAADDPDLNPEGGYCTRSKYIWDYLDNEKLQIFAKKFDKERFKTVENMLKALASNDNEVLQKLIHPKNGLTLSAMTFFDKRSDKTFDRDSFIRSFEKKDNLFWGKDETTGNPINMKLSEYFEKFPTTIDKISKIVALKEIKNLSYKSYPFKNFQKKRGQLIQGYEIYWTGKENPEYNWQGLVVILEYYRDKWYIVGMLKDYWTP